MPTPGYIPGPLVIPDTFQIRLKWALGNGRIATNVLHAIVGESIVASVNMANDLFEAIATDSEVLDYMQYLSSNTALLLCDIRDIRPRDDGAFPSLVESNFPGIDGTGSGNPLPQEVALVVTLRTALSGRAHRGRTYLTGFDEIVLDSDGHATGDVTAAAVSFMQSVRGHINLFVGAMAVGHRGHAEYINAQGNTVLAELPGSDPVVTCVINDNVFDSQRRRK